MGPHYIHLDLKNIYVQSASKTILHSSTFWHYASWGSTLVESGALGSEKVRFGPVYWSFWLCPIKSPVSFKCGQSASSVVFHFQTPLECCRNGVMLNPLAERSYERKKTPPSQERPIWTGLYVSSPLMMFGTLDWHKAWWVAMTDGGWESFGIFRIGVRKKTNCGHQRWWVNRAQ